MSDPVNQAIRRTCQHVRKQLSTHFQQRVSNKICSRIRGLNQYRYAKHIALYHAVDGEIDLSSLWRSAPLHGKFCYFPVINDHGELSFLPATPTSNFRLNHFGILEPDVPPHHAIAVGNLDIIFAPLVAFDIHGTRIGMGKGFYDRTLAHQRPQLLLGVAYEFQRQAYIKPHAWDVPLDGIATEKTIYWSHA